MDERLAQSIGSERFNMVLLTLFAAVALCLGATGLYGVISYTTTQRTHETGIRMALGAERRDVMRSVLGQAGTLTFAGITMGLLGAVVLTRFLTTLLFGVRSTDPVTFISVAGVLTGVSLLASYIPARRATKVDPMVTLRHE
jgi:putative ABC transport system permease protein